MEQVLTELEIVLDALSNPARLEGEELALLSGRWVLSISRLKEVMSKKPNAERRDLPRLRKRLEIILARMPEVQTLLINHKTEVADQLFSENRRVQAIRQGGYGALVNRPQLIHQRA
jgi:hypothetical protein